MREGSSTPEKWRLRAARVEPVTDDLAMFVFVAAEGSTLDGLAFTPGQVAVLSMPGIEDSYLAIASPPDYADRVEFLVKRGGDLGERLFALALEAEVEMSGPVGTGFPVDDFAEKDLIFVAMGTAIAPVRATLLHALERRTAFGRIVLVYGARRQEEFAFADELDRWREAGVTVELTASKPGEGWAGATGRVQTLLVEAARDALDPVAFVCGSDEMMEQTSETLMALGLPRERILRNY